MYLFAPNDRQDVDDFREAVHDSNGLLMHSGTGELAWRPVVIPSGCGSAPSRTRTCAASV